MTAKDQLDRGNLRGALDEATAEVKARPADDRARTLLFELLCFSGDLDRAGKQLDALEGRDTTLALAVLGYRSILEAERARRACLAGKARPGFLDGEPPAAAARIDALRRAALGDRAGARAALEGAEKARPRLAGSVDGRAFADFRDADDVIGPFLEAFVGAQYVWIPFASLSSLTLEAPKRLRDLVWARGKAALRGGEVGDVVVPVLYGSSHESADDAVRLGRKTDWTEESEGIVRGLGQRVFFLGEGEGLPVLEAREIAFEPVAGPS